MRRTPHAPPSSLPHHWPDYPTPPLALLPQPHLGVVLIPIICACFSTCHSPGNQKGDTEPGDYFEYDACGYIAVDNGISCPSSTCIHWRSTRHRETSSANSYTSHSASVMHLMRRQGETVLGSFAFFPFPTPSRSRYWYRPKAHTTQ